jgi:hypothetical protein
VLQDEDLADSIAETEQQLRSGQFTATALRDATRAAIEARYLESAAAGHSIGPDDAVGRPGTAGLRPS